MSNGGRLGGLFSDRENPGRYERLRPLHETLAGVHTQQDDAGPQMPVTPTIAPSTPPALPGKWRQGAHYTVVLYAPVEPVHSLVVGRSLVCGHYQLWGRADQSYRGKLVHADSPTAEEAEYRILIRALTDIHERIRRGGVKPEQFTVDIYSRCEAVMVQLMSSRPPTGVLLGPLHLQARTLLGRFGPATLIRKQNGAIERLLRV